MKLFETAKKNWQKEWRRRSKPIFILVLLLLVGAFVLLFNQSSKFSYFISSVR
jgi:RsiW-degrading membrane proteinase PrsW (M82 family)